MTPASQIRGFPRHGLGGGQACRVSPPLSQTPPPASAPPSEEGTVTARALCPEPPEFPPPPAGTNPGLTPIIAHQPGASAGGETPPLPTHTQDHGRRCRWAGPAPPRAPPRWGDDPCPGPAVRGASPRPPLPSPRAARVVVVSRPRCAGRGAGPGAAAAAGPYLRRGPGALPARRSAPREAHGAVVGAPGPAGAGAVLGGGRRTPHRLLEQLQPPVSAATPHLGGPPPHPGSGAGGPEGAGGAAPCWGWALPGGLCPGRAAGPEPSWDWGRGGPSPGLGGVEGPVFNPGVVGAEPGGAVPLRSRGAARPVQVRTGEGGDRPGGPFRSQGQAGAGPLPSPRGWRGASPDAGAQGSVLTNTALAPAAWAGCVWGGLDRAPEHPGCAQEPAPGTGCGCGGDPIPGIRPPRL